MSGVRRWIGLGVWVALPLLTGLVGSRFQPGAWLFFGRQSPGLAVADISALWALIVLLIVLFWRARRTAGILLLPYLAWVSFATALNFAIWRLNA